MLTIKRRAHVSQDHEFTFTVRELVEKFTDNELREAGLFRDLRDADIARRDELERQAAHERNACDDDDCDCACHSSHRNSTGGVAARELSERQFWPLVRTFAIRGDLANVVHELESRAWSNGGTTIDFSHAFAPKG